MKKTFAKVLALALCAVLLVTGTVFMTLAFLQDKTNVVKNTFTSARISITLKESVVNELGEKQGTDRVEKGMEYRLIPGNDYVKDPIVTVEAGSEECYLVIAIHDTMFDDTDIEEVYNSKGTIYGQLEKYGWQPLDKEFAELADSFFESKIVDGEETNLMAGWMVTDEDNNSYPDYTLYYYCPDGTLASAKIPTSNQDQPFPVFDGFKLKGKDYNANILADAENRSLEIVAFAFQTSGYGSEDEMSVPTIIGNAFNNNFGIDVSSEGTPEIGGGDDSGINPNGQ